jgi:hypothetical protein
MSASPEPRPPWRVRLQGVDADLKDLASCVKQGPVRVFQEDHEYFLESKALDDVQNSTDALQKARELVKVISSVARVRRSIASRSG